MLRMVILTLILMIMTMRMVIHTMILMTLMTMMMSMLELSLSKAPVVLCGCMADLRTDQETVSHLSRLGRSVVTLDQALAIAAQVEAVSYVETAAQLSVEEIFQLFSVTSMAALEAR